LKILDAREPLSVQVHPNDEQAAPGNSGKTEAWVVLHAEPGARIYAGLRGGVDERALIDSIRANRVADVLHSFEPKVGDCIYLPAGTVHALGAGLLVFEVQQTSDVTYRLHDWGRIDARTGRPRELHLEHGVACIDWKRGPVSPVTRGADLLVDCPYFRLWCRKGKNCVYLGTRGEFRLVIALDAPVLIDDVFGEAALAPGAACLIPPEATDANVWREGPFTILECGPPAAGPL